MSRTFSSFALAVCLVALTAAALAALTRDVVGSYLGISLSMNQASAARGLTQTVGSDERDGAGKFCARYQLTDNVGVEAGCVPSGTLQDHCFVVGAPISQPASARRWYVVVTGRLPLGGEFTLTGRAGLWFGKVSASDRRTGSTTTWPSRLI